MSKQEATKTGFKGVHHDLTGYGGMKFEIGVWSEPIVGPLQPCHNGYHFCSYEAGVYAYYTQASDRIFAVEAEDVLVSEEPGTLAKHVARRIRLVREITHAKNGGVASSGTSSAEAANSSDADLYLNNTGDGNTGSGNTGDRNSGNYNVGDYNTGHGNAGHGNAGDRNSGNYNVGDYNTGYRNIGDCNTGNGNTGYRNIGHRNSGDGNSGNCNIGYYNIGNFNNGHGNIGDSNSGYFCTGTMRAWCFDAPTKLSHAEFQQRYSSLALQLLQFLREIEPGSCDYTTFAELPNFSLEKVQALHKQLYRKADACQ